MGCDVGFKMGVVCEAPREVGDTWYFIPSVNAGVGLVKYDGEYTRLV